MPKNPVISLRPNVQPPGFFQLSDDLADLKRHTNQNSEGLGKKWPPERVEVLVTLFRNCDPSSVVRHR
jgi:hypothetical protein